MGVALLHMSGLQALEGLRQTTGIFAYGWVGVDLFFIISGFIMVWVTRNTDASLKTTMSFLAIRAARIFPLWWVCVSFMALFFLIIHGSPASLDIIPKDQAWGYFARSFLLVPQERAPLLDVGWTLIHELFFYLTFALIIVLGLRKKLLWGLAIWGVVTIAGIFLNFGDINPALKVIFSPLSFLFMAGALIGMLQRFERGKGFAWPALGLSVLIILFMIISGVLDKHFRVAQLVLPLSLLLWSVVSLEQLGKLKVQPVLIWLGTISYALYLTHPLVIAAWRVIGPFYQDGFLSSINAKIPEAVLLCVDMLALITAFLLTAAIFHRCIEKPALRFARNKIPAYRPS